MDTSAWYTRKKSNNGLSIRTRTKVIRRKHIIQPTGFGAYRYKKIYGATTSLVTLMFHYVDLIISSNVSIGNRLNNVKWSFSMIWLPILHQSETNVARLYYVTGILQCWNEEWIVSIWYQNQDGLMLNCMHHGKFYIKFCKKYEHFLPSNTSIFL